MLDIKWIAAEPQAFDAALKRRGLPPQAEELGELNRRRLEMIKRVESLRSERKLLAKRVALAKKRDEDWAEAERRALETKRRLAVAEAEQREIERALREKLLLVPNRLDDDVKDGIAPHILKQVGEKPTLKTPQNHSSLGQALGLMEFGEAAKISGARFVILKGDLARLERALAEFMLRHNVDEYGYEEVSPPLLVKEAAMLGTGQLPKFAEDLFATEDQRFWLIPTAEVPLTNLARERTFGLKELPKRYTALTPCFRSEAGAAGKDTKGMIRQHQFYKVELVSITSTEHGRAELERMTECAEALLTKLGLCWRRVMLASEDTGFAAIKTYDLEVWCAGQGKFLEISSCSDCGTFQARRMRARIDEGGFVNTLNGSSLAVGRTLLAILEHYQDEKGEIAIPKVLHEYMGGQERICGRN